MFSARILSVGYERELLRLRSLLLRQSLTVEVLEAVDLAEALRIARGKERIDLVVLCHTVTTAHQRMIMGAAQEEHGDVQVLSILPGIFAADTVGSPVTNDPEEFLSAVKQALPMIRNQVPQASKGAEISLDRRNLCRKGPLIQDERHGSRRFRKS
jgi:hypothetical protein